MKRVSPPSAAEGFDAFGGFWRVFPGAITTLEKNEAKMTQIKTHTTDLSLTTKGETDIVDITEPVEEAVRSSGVREGQALVFAAGSTVGITAVEYESGVLRDLREAFEKLAPRRGRYHHEDAWHDGNGYAHVRSGLLGQSRVFPVRSGKLVRGTWQQIVLVDFDNRPRRRAVTVQVLGE